MARSRRRIRRSYTVTHAGGTTEVVVDQSAIERLPIARRVRLRAGEAFSVDLGDNTGETYVSTAKVAIMFDAVRVVPADGTGDGSGSDGTGDGDDDDSMGSGCSVSGTGSPLLMLLGLALLRRRRR